MFQELNVRIPSKIQRAFYKDIVKVGSDRQLHHAIRFFNCKTIKEREEAVLNMIWTEKMARTIYFSTWILTSIFEQYFEKNFRESINQLGHNPIMLNSIMQSNINRHLLSE